MICARAWLLRGGLGWPSGPRQAGTQTPPVMRACPKFKGQHIGCPLGVYGSSFPTRTTTKQRQPPMPVGLVSFQGPGVPRWQTMHFAPPCSRKPLRHLDKEHGAQLLFPCALGVETGVGRDCRTVQHQSIQAPVFTVFLWHWCQVVCRGLFKGIIVPHGIHQNCPMMAPDATSCCNTAQPDWCLRRRPYYVDHPRHTVHFPMQPGSKRPVELPQPNTQRQPP